MNNKNKLLSLTLVYVHLLAESHSEGYLPAFTFSLCESDAPASRRMHIVLFVSSKLKKNKKDNYNMKKKLVILSTIVLLFSCGQTKKEKTLLSENTVKPDSTLTNSTSEKDSLEKLMKFREESLNSEYKNYKIYNLNEIINEDFNGDGVIDKAEFKRLKTSGIIITDGRTNKETKLGFGKQFAHMTDFNWVSFWGVLKDTTTFEITFDDKTGDILGDTIVKLKNKSIFVEEDEVGGGVITYENDSYKWIHQSD